MDRRNFLEKSLFLIAGASLLPLTAEGKRQLANQKIVLRFAVASDGHYGQTGTQFESFHDQMMEWLRHEHSQQPLSFCMFNGDLIHDDASLLPSVKSKFDSLQIPYYVTRGNHDHCDSNTWRRTWNLEFNYSFELSDNAFMALDTSNIAGAYVCPDIKWTQRALTKHRKCKNLFVFMHIPPRQWTPNAINCPRVMKMFGRQENLRAVFHGHEHNHDNAQSENGILHLFDSHIGGNWGTTYRGYRIVEVYDSGEIATYQMNPADEIKVNSNSIA